MSLPLPPILLTDVKYRASLAAVQALGKAGYPVYTAQTEAELQGTPPAFSSVYAKGVFLVPGSCYDVEYPARLAEICNSIRAEKEQVPVLFPIGAATLSQVAGHSEELASTARFLISPPEVLDRANDKRAVAELAQTLNIPIPEEFDCREDRLPPRFPVVVKPRCGEKLGLHAEERYCKVYQESDFAAAYSKMARFDPEPVVQELLTGDGVGVSAVMDQNSRPVSVVCHRRIREYPIEGGPSACCESFWDGTLVRYAVELLQALHFVGIAMVEFKDGKLLEINPRVWGSFPLTEKCGSPFSLRYVQAASGNAAAVCEGPEYKEGIRMRFLLNDTLACLSYLCHGQPGKALSGLTEPFRPKSKEALFSWRDPKPFFLYLKNTLTKRGD